MRRPRHRVKSNLLWKTLGIAALANALLWPILIRLGAFHGVSQGLVPVTLVSQPPPPKPPKPVPSPAKTPPAPAPAVAVKPPAPAPVIPKAPPTPKPKPVLVATAPPDVRRPADSAAEKPPVPSDQGLPDDHKRRKPRATKDDVMAKEPAPRRHQERPAPKIAAVPVFPKPTPTKPAATKPAPIKPAERVAVTPPPAVSPPPPTPANPDGPPVLSAPPRPVEAPPSETSGPKLQQAVAVVKTQPEIPKSMQNHAWHALFRGQFTVDKNGAVTPRMLSSTGNADLDARALEAARHWKFRPATRNGVPVASTVKFEIEYSVRAVP